MGETDRRRLGVHLADERLRYLAAGLGYVIAGLHLFHPDYGVAQLVVRLSIDPSLLVGDPRPLAFTLSGIAILGGVLVVLVGGPEQPVYALGIALMGAYITGYFAWHFSGHGGFLPGRESLHHGLPAHEAAISHLAGDPWALTAVLAEGILLVVLAVLYWRTR